MVCSKDGVSSDTDLIPVNVQSIQYIDVLARCFQNKSQNLIILFVYYVKKLKVVI